jgi:hypothetical protein
MTSVATALSCGYTSCRRPRSSCGPSCPHGGRERLPVRVDLQPAGREFRRGLQMEQKPVRAPGGECLICVSVGTGQQDRVRRQVECVTVPLQNGRSSGSGSEDRIRRRARGSRTVPTPTSGTAPPTRESCGRRCSPRRSTPPPATALHRRPGHGRQPAHPRGPRHRRRRGRPGDEGDGDTGQKAGRDGERDRSRRCCPWWRAARPWAARPSETAVLGRRADSGLRRQGGRYANRLPAGGHRRGLTSRPLPCP